MGNVRRGLVVLTSMGLWLAAASASSQTSSRGDTSPLAGASPDEPLVAAARRALKGGAGGFELQWGAKRFRSGSSFRAGTLSISRFQQQVGGLPLLGGSLSVVLNQVGELVYVHDRSSDQLDLMTAPPRMTADVAIEQAQSIAGWPRLRGSARATLLAWPGSPWRAAYLVDLPLSPPPTTLALVLDASDGSLIDWARRDLRRFRASVFETNPVASSLIEVELPQLPPEAEVLEGRFAHVARCRLRDGECRPAHEAGADGEGDFFFEPEDEGREERDPFSEVSAYHHVNRIRELFAGLGLTDEQLPELRVWVNVPGVNNAAFSPLEPMLIFGQGRRDYAYDGDVVYHEYTHGVVDVTAGLLPVFTSPGLSHMPGALNEGTADQFSTALSDDPRLGEYAGGYARWGQGEVRDMIGAARCPDDQIGEVHKDGVPWSQFMWELRELLGSERYLNLAWAVLTLLAPTDGPADAAAALLALLADQGDAAEMAAAAESIERHGLEECQSVLPLDWRRQRGAVNFSAMALSDGRLDMEFPSYLQYRFEVPEGTTELTITKRLLGCSGCEHSILLRRDQPVAFRMSGVVAPRLEIEADRVVENERSTTLLDPAPGIWFVASTNRGLQTFYFSTSYDLAPRPALVEEEPDSGTPERRDSADAGTADVDFEDAAQDEPGQPSTSSASGCTCALGDAPAWSRALEGAEAWGRSARTLLLGR